MLEAEAHLRKIIGHRDLAKLAGAVERDVTAKRAARARTDPLHNPLATTPPQVEASPA